MDEALDLFEVILSQEHKLEVTVFNILIDGMFKTGKTQVAKDTFNVILSKQLVPVVVTYTIMMRGLIKEGLMDEVDDVFVDGEIWMSIKFYYAQCSCPKFAQERRN